METLTNADAGRLDVVLASGWRTFEPSMEQVEHLCPCLLFRFRCPTFMPHGCEYAELDRAFSPNSLDHVSYWTRSGRRLDAVVGQPYAEVGTGVHAKLSALAGRDGLTIREDADVSWWYPGRTIAVIITRAPETFPEKSPDRAPARSKCFTEWLLRYRGHDPVGDLADDVRADSGWPVDDDRNSLHWFHRYAEHLGVADAHDPVGEAFKSAWLRYQLQVHGADDAAVRAEEMRLRTLARADPFARIDPDRPSPSIHAEWAALRWLLGMSEELDDDE